MTIPRISGRRWLTFNLVGIAGAGVQLGILALLNRIAPARYLLNSSLALEVTLLHNFAWHMRYTWRDRRCGSSTTIQLLRFHLSNGAVSLFGNLGLMRLLVHNAHMPVVAANATAILICSVINYTLGDRWTFARTRDTLAIAATSR